MLRGYNSAEQHQRLHLSPGASTPVIVYIAGPMTGIPQENRPAFLAARRHLMDLGFTVIDPVQVNANFMGVAHPEQPTQAAPGLRADMMALCIANAICLLPGWEQSRGARLEVAMAITFGFVFIDLESGDQIDRPPFVVVTHGYGDTAPDGPGSYADMWLAISILLQNADGNGYAERAEKLLLAALFAQKLQTAVKKYAVAFGICPDRTAEFELTDEEIEAVRVIVHDRKVVII